MPQKRKYTEDEFQRDLDYLIGLMGGKKKRSPKPKKAVCAKGTIRRNAYTRTNKSGKKVHVEAACIKDVGTPGKFKKRANKYLAEKKAEQTKAAKKTNSKNIKCPPGQIKRAAYIRNAYTKKDGTKVPRKVVPASCIDNKGAPGKGPKKIVILDKGALKQYGYDSKLPEQERKKILIRAAKGMGAEALWKRLLGAANLQIRTNPTVSKRMKRDSDWVRTTLAKKVFSK